MIYIPYVHYSPNISFLPTAMTTPAISPTSTLADPSTSTSQDEVDKEQSQSNDNANFIIPLPKDFGFIPVPRHLRYNPTKPFHFGLLLNIGFGFASTFSELLPPPFFRSSNRLNFDYSRCESLLLSAVAQ